MQETLALATFLCCPLFCRFLRHVPVIYVDYPGAKSLKQIYGTFNRAMMRLIPELRAYADPLTNAMVDFYMMSQVQKPVSFVLVYTRLKLFSSHIFLS